MPAVQESSVSRVTFHAAKCDIRERPLKLLLHLPLPLRPEHALTQASTKAPPRLDVKVHTCPFRRMGFSLTDWRLMASSTNIDHRFH